MATTDKVTRLAEQDCSAISEGLKNAGSIFSKNTVPQLISETLELSQKHSQTPSSSPSNLSATRLAEQQLGRSA